MYLYNTWEETGDESVECRALRKFLRQIELHKTGASCGKFHVVVLVYYVMHLVDNVNLLGGGSCILRVNT